jgi:hypothetical protein
VCGHLARLEPLDRALGHTGLLGQGSLREVALEACGREPLTQLAKDRLVGKS